MLAAEGSHKLACKRLLEIGAVPTMCDNSGFTAI